MLAEQSGQRLDAGDTDRIAAQMRRLPAHVGAVRALDRLTAAGSRWWR